MGRPPKKKVKLSEDSFLSLAQETYNELVEQRSTCIRQINENKKKVDIEDMHDLSAINKSNTDLLKIVDNTMDKKINLIKLMSTLIFKSGGGSSGGKVVDENLTPEDLAMLEKMFGDKPDENDGGEYKIKD
jgi:hypothetical protein